MSSLKERKKLDDFSQETRDIVYGYIRRIIDSDSSNSKGIIVPPLINHLCLLFYQPRFFDKVPDCLDLTDMNGDDKETITKIDSKYHTIYSRGWMDSRREKVCELTLKFLVVSDGASIGYGLVNDKHVVDLNKECYEEAGTFILWNSGYAFKNGKSISNGNMRTYSGNVIKMRLDFAERCIKVLRKGAESKETVIRVEKRKTRSVPKYDAKSEEASFTFKNIHKENEHAKYRFAFSLRSKGDQLSVISFKCYNT